MPIRRGRFAPQNTFLETIAEKFDRGNSNFVLGSAQEQNNYPIVYCSDGFCELTGFSRSELMRRSCACNFLYGLESCQEDIRSIKTALATQTELKKEIQFYKKNGSPFWCLLDIIPIKNENGNVVLFLASHKDISRRKISGETREETASTSSQASGQKTQKLSRSRSRKFSRDVLLHLSRQYGQNSSTNKPNARRPVKRTRSFSFTSERLPQYKRESTKKSKFLLVHYSTAKGLWDWGILLLTIYIAVMVPFNVAFQGHDRVKNLVILDMVVQLFFIMDIVVHFRTTFVDPSGKIIYDQKKIASHYLKSWFILDFLAALPFEVLSFVNQSWALAVSSSFDKGFLIQLLKCGRLVRLLRVIRKLHRFTDHSTVLLSLLMMAFAMAAHWLACIWFVIGKAEIDNHSKVSWLYQLGEAIDMSYGNFTITGGPSEGSAYITALYFTVTSMTTVGFGNVSANTNGEKVFAVIVMLIGALMHAAIFGNVAAIIQKLYANRVRYHSRASEIKQFIRIHRIDEDLSNRLEDYFHNTWSLSGGVDTREILATFPPELQAEVCMHMYRGLLELPAFSQATRGCLRMLSLQVRPVYVSPGELLLTKSDVVNALYYIASGSMEVLQGETVAAILGKGDLFGEDITRKIPIRRSNGDVRALTYCDVYYITRDRFHDVLHLYSDFAFKFTEKLELTYDLGASEKDIWRRGGLDSISEDEEAEEEEEKDKKEGTTKKKSETTIQGNGTCRSGMRKIRSSSPIYRRPRHIFPTDNWKHLRIHSSEFKSDANHVEKVPLITLSEDRMRHALSRQCAVDVNTPKHGTTRRSSRLDEILSSQSLEWEQENLQISLHAGDMDAINESRNNEHEEEGRKRKEEDVKISSESLKSNKSTISDLSVNNSPDFLQQNSSEFSKHLYITCENPNELVQSSNEGFASAPKLSEVEHSPDFLGKNSSEFSKHLYITCENPDELVHSSNEGLKSAPNLSEVEHEESPFDQEFDSDVDDASETSESSGVSRSTEFLNVAHRMSRMRDAESPPLVDPFDSDTLNISFSMSDTGSVKRRFAELPFQYERRPSGSQTLLGGVVSPDECNSPGDSASHRSLQGSQDSSKHELSNSGSPLRRDSHMSEELHNDCLSASIPSLPRGTGSLANGVSYDGHRLREPLRQALTWPKSATSSNCSLSSENSLPPSRRRKMSSVIQPPTIFAPLVTNARNPYKDFFPPSSESLVCDCDESNSSREKITNVNYIERSTEERVDDQETAIENIREEEFESNVPFVRTGNVDRKLYKEDHSSSSFSVSPVATDFSIASRSAISDNLPDDFVHQGLPLYEEESYYFTRRTSELTHLTGARSAHSVKHEKDPAELMSPTRPIRTSFSEPHLRRPAFVSAWKTPYSQRGCDENSNIPKQDNLEETIAEDPLQLNAGQLEDIFRDVTTTKDAVQKLQTILCSSEPDICSELADTRQTVQRLDKQVLDLNKGVSSLSRDVKTVLELLRGLRNVEPLR